MPTIPNALAAAALALALPAAALAEGISTHVLDISSGIGAGGVPVTLSREQDGEWSEVASATTAENGRVESFDFDLTEGRYQLAFDMTAYQQEPFFPEIDVTFEVDDAGADHHVPVLVSPYGYSTYRGN